MKKTLQKFLEKNHASASELFYFAKDLTLEQFLNTCQRGDWILWLFVRMNPDSLQELTLAKGHCANTVRELMKDRRSTKAVDVAISFGEGKATKKELDDAAWDAWGAAAVADDTDDSAARAADSAAYAATAWTADSAAYAATAWGAASSASSAACRVAADAANAVAWASGDFDEVAKKQNQKQTADICRKYLPLEIWNQDLI